ncbi:PLP-dependent aminotransferase family protein [Kiloniella laminariae]|uniref:MocR-like ectoine utilization transcription factor EhuR n=1 Tax=Kiloniella laminariae TaxID=454162 RepID=UPI000382D758|nr:PLP-dependent aminotransferase family protein [Kiloniella laminariae]
MPKVKFGAGARYIAIADALSEDIRNGFLQQGDRLPTHRDLSWHLGVTVGTVSRAYAEAERRGLTFGEVGRGTFVHGPSPAEQHMLRPARFEDQNIILMDFAYPPPGDTEEKEMASTLQSMSAGPELSRLLSYQPHAGLKNHREAGAQWLELNGLTVEPDNIVLTAGAHHAIAVTMAAVARPGDRVLCEELTYPGIQSVSRMLGLRLEGLAIDANGIVPEAFEEACLAGDAKFLYCVPNFQNPTTRLLSMERRQAIADIARRYRVSIIEDDVFGLIVDNALPPITSLAPERSYYITSLAKTVAPGLRVGYMTGPQHSIPSLISAVRATCWMASPITAEIASRWIINGAAERILEGRKESARRRVEIARKIFAQHEIESETRGLYIWLHLPAPWRSSQFVYAAGRAGVTITASEPFIVGRKAPPHAVRICLGQPESDEKMTRGLEILLGLLTKGPDVDSLVF